ncbi:hypothetical protein ABZ446_34030 [Streptomyces sp. NPDC005813]|uniref:hypothetical protein n=1 Tax=Streptomyces sp. NPDC005813 TaxID=3155592 RepID=UPI0033DC08E7
MPVAVESGVLLHRALLPGLRVQPGLRGRMPPVGAVAGELGQVDRAAGLAVQAKLPQRPAGVVGPVADHDPAPGEGLGEAREDLGEGGRLFDAQEAGANDRELKEITAEALREVYFQDQGRRAGQLEEVRFTDIEHLDFDL